LETSSEVLKQLIWHRNNYRKTPETLEKNIKKAAFKLLTGTFTSSKLFSAVNMEWKLEKATSDREGNYEANISVTILELVGAFIEGIKRINL
jgi:hypothetical protein